MPHIVPASDAWIAEAAARLRAGGVVAMPTETVYGLAADTFSLPALRRVYELKGRPADNPLIAHVLDGAMARTRLVATWDDRCEQLASRFWPGPLTLVLPRRPGVPEEATGGRATIAVRSPRHLAARGLIARLGSPISAPSANRSGHVSPTTARHVAREFSAVDDLLILDGGPCEVGIESTVLDLASPAPRILRPGTVTAEMLREIVGEVDEPAIVRQGASPGTALKHYAPRTRCVMMKSREVAEALSDVATFAIALVLDPTLATSLPPGARSQVILLPADPGAYAARLYSALHEADSHDAEVILIEEPPRAAGVWSSIHNRLRRACAA